MIRARSIVIGTAFVLLSAVIVVGQSAGATAKADGQGEALAEAARKGDAAAVKTLLDEGVDVNTKFRYGATALSYACDRGHLDAAKLLLEHGAQGKEQAFLGAVSEPDVATTKVILDSGGISPDLLSDALDAAQNGKQADLVALLERAGAKPRVEFKIDDAQLALYAGTYRGPRE